MDMALVFMVVANLLGVHIFKVIKFSFAYNVYIMLCVFVLCAYWNCFYARKKNQHTNFIYFNVF